VDDEALFSSRSPLDMYSDFMSAFSKEFESELEDGTIVEIQVGTGPSGELRYPSYPSSLWSFPGVGEFQVSSSSIIILEIYFG